MYKDEIFEIYLIFYPNQFLFQLEMIHLKECVIGHDLLSVVTTC